jgi:hypothetical protein
MIPVTLLPRQIVDKQPVASLAGERVDLEEAVASPFGTIDGALCAAPCGFQPEPSRLSTAESVCNKSPET